MRILATVFSTGDNPTHVVLVFLLRLHATVVVSTFIHLR